jgi:serine/threonine-protein phosphatase 6 regulatory ankyrin repeat subunit B
MALASIAATKQKANSDLLEAAKDDDELKVVAALAQPGVDVNCCDDEGYDCRTPLLLACKLGNLRVFRILLEDHRVDVNARDTQGRTVLHLWKTEYLVKKILLSERTDIDWNAADMIGQTPLLWFARMGAEESVRRLIGVESVNLFATTIDGFTALHQVAERKTPFPYWATPGDISDRCNIVDLVLEEVGRRGHNVVSFVDTTDILNRSALHYIAEEGCIEILEKLCKFSANMNVNGVDFHGFTPLHLAVRNGHDAVVERLLQLQSIDANVRATVNASNPDNLKPFEEPQSWICRPNLFLEIPEAQPSRDLTPLHFAVVDGRMEVVRLLLEREGINIDPVDSAGLTPLQYSVQNGHWEIVELLLKKGKPFATLNINAVDSAGRTPLHFAVMNGRMEVVRLLLEWERINIDPVDSASLTPLQYSVQNGHWEIVELLLKKGKPFTTLNIHAVDSAGRTPLHFAVTDARMEGVRLLLEWEGININAVDSAGRTPLHFAVMDGRMEVVRLLLEREGINLNPVDSAGLTPLHYSVQNGPWKMVQLLLKKGKPFATLDYDRQCDVFEDLLHLATKREEKITAKIIAIQLLSTLGSRMNAFTDISTKFSGKQSFSNQSRLFASAAISNRFEIIKYIVKWQPKVNVNDRSEWAAIHGLVATPLHFAAVERDVATMGGRKRGHVEAVQELLEHPKLDVNAEDNKKMTPLLYAIEAGNVDMVKVLYEKDKFNRLNIDAVDSAGRTPLHFAVMDGRMEVVKVLLEWEGINIDAEDSAGLTPLHHSVQNGQTEMMKLLLNKGKPFVTFDYATVDYNRQCHFFEDLLCLATKSGHVETVQELLEHPRLDVNAEDNKKMTPLRYAIEAGNVDMVKVLCQKDQFHRLNIDAVDSAGRTPLHYSIQNGHSEVVELLLKKGKPFATLDYDRQCDVFEDLLHLATKREEKTIAIQLLNTLGSRMNAFADISTKFFGNQSFSDQSRLLASAAVSNHFKIIKYIVKWQPEVNVNERSEWAAIPGLVATPLHFAAVERDVATMGGRKRGHVEAVQELLEHPKLDVNAEDNKKMTPLLYAIEAGNVDMVKVLYEKDKFNRLNIDAVDNAGRTPLHFAVMDGRMEVVRLLLEWEGINIDAVDNAGYTPLHIVVMDGRMEVVRLLLEQEGINIDAMDIAGLTPLHYSIQNGHSEVVELLLKKGKPFATLDYDRQCDVFEDLLHLATKREEKTIAIQLLNTLGSRMNAFADISNKFSGDQSFGDQSRLLAFAAVSNHFEIIKYIVKWQPEVNVNERSEWAVIPGLVATPLHFAVVERDVATVGGRKRGHVEVVQELLEHPKLDVNAEDNKKMTPLMYAIEASNVDMVKVLYEKDKFNRLNIDAVDNAGRTPLHFAVMDGCMEVVRLLLEWEGININAVGSAGLTPLQYSVQNGHWEIVELLLKKGKPFATLNIDAVDSAGRTPLHCAVMDVCMEVVRLLLEWEGIKIDAVDSAGLTPLHYSVQNGHSEMVELLLKKGKPFATLDYDRQCNVFKDLLCLATEREEKTIAIQLLNKLGSRMKDFADIANKFSGDQSFGDQSRLLALAAVSNHFEIIKYIVKWQPEVNVNEKSKWAAIPGLVATPLHFAAVAVDVPTVGGPERGHVEAVKELLKHPTLDVNAEDNTKMTPLLYAIKARNVDMVKALCQNDIFNRLRANEENPAGKTPLQIVVEDNNLSENPNLKAIEKVLLERPEVKDFVDRLYRDRQVFVDAANALLVGAALIASVTFAGWLQPALGYTPYYDFSQPFPAPPGAYESYAAIKQNPKVKAFWVFNSLSFFFAIATVLAGADAAMPSLMMPSLEESSNP